MISPKGATTMKINQEWAKENRIINLELQNARMELRESKQAYANDMKELKAELAKDPSDWNCETIDNMARCAKDRANEIIDWKAEIETLKNKQAVNLWKKYSD